MTILLCFNVFSTGVPARDSELLEVWKQILKLNGVNIALVDSTNGELFEVQQPNVRIVKDCNRPTFEFWMKYMKSSTKSDEICGIIMNSDIIPSQSLIDLLNTNPNVMKANDCWALTRWNIKSCKPKDFANATLFGGASSQDVWVFKLPLFNVMNSDVNFFLGKWGCDNRFAYELKKHGYKVTNPCRTIKTYHLHNVGITREPLTERIPPPYFPVSPCNLK